MVGRGAVKPNLPPPSFFRSLNKPSVFLLGDNVTAGAAERRGAAAERALSMCTTWRKEGACEAKGGGMAKERNGGLFEVKRGGDGEASGMGGGERREGGRRRLLLPLLGGSGGDGGMAVTGGKGCGWARVGSETTGEGRVVGGCGVHRKGEEWPGAG